MKITYWRTAMLLGALALMTSCENDDDDDNNDLFNSADVSALQNAAQSGSWRITRFVDDGEDVTSAFDGFVFTFNANGTVTSDNGANSFNGTWQIELDDDDDIDDTDDLEFVITFSTSNDDFDDLTEDWDVLEFSDTRIRLADDDADDLLTFERS